MLCDEKDTSAKEADTAQPVPGLAARCRKPALITIAATAVYMTSNVIGGAASQSTNLPSLYDMQPVNISVSEIQSDTTVAELD